MLGHLIFELEITWRSTYASYKVYQLLALGRRWFSPGTPASSTTKARRHDIAEILLKLVLNTNNLKKSKHMIFDWQITLNQFISRNPLTSIVTIWKTQHTYAVSIIS